MIQATCDRLTGLVAPEDMLIVTNKLLVDPIREPLPGLPPQAILGEPCKRDTAPCIGLAAAIIAKLDPAAVMLVLPADHVIRNVAEFQIAIRQALDLVEQNPRQFVTFGIRPTYAAETFGYIERGAALMNPETSRQAAATYRVKMFREKPTVNVAQQYLDAGGFYWNAGIFVWRASAVLAALAKFEPTLHDNVVQIAATYGTPDFPAVLERDFPLLNSKSIDYAIMEKYDSVAVIEAPFDWDDVGNWQSMARQHGADANENTVHGRHLGVQTRGCIVRSDNEHLIVTVGLEDCIVVHTPDATLVARKQDEESIRQVVAQLKDLGWNEFL